MGSCYWRHSPGAHFMALSICRCVPLCSRTLWKSLADISDFLSYRVRYLMRKDQSATALESGLDIPFSRLKQRPFVPLLSQVAYLSPLGNVANWMGSETVWASRKGRWLQLRDKSDAVLNSAANWKPIPWRVRDFSDGLSVKVITVDVLSFPCLGDDQRGAVWSPHLRHNPLGLSGDMLTTHPEGFLVMLMYMGFHPLEWYEIVILQPSRSHSKLGKEQRAVWETWRAEHCAIHILQPRRKESLQTSSTFRWQPIQTF